MMTYEEAERQLHEKVLSLYNVDMPAYMIVNYAVRNTDVCSKLKDGNTPLMHILNEYSDSELISLVKAIDDEYTENPSVVAYIAEYLRETYPEADEMQLKVEMNLLVRSLPQNVLRMNASENYKVCFYIASQRKALRGDNSDVSAALVGSPEMMEKVYSQLCDNMKQCMPIDVAMHNAGRSVNKDYNIEASDVKYNPNESPEGNLKKQCGDEAYERYKEKSKVLRAAATVLNTPQNIKNAIDDARRENMGEERYAEYKAEKQEKKEAKAAARSVQPRATGYGNQSAYGNSYGNSYGNGYGNERRGLFRRRQGYGNSYGGSYGGRGYGGRMNSSTITLIHWILGVLCVALNVYMITKSPFSFKWVALILSSVIAVASLIGAQRKRKVWYILALIPSIALSIYAIFFI